MYIIDTNYLDVLDINTLYQKSRRPVRCISVLLSDGDKRESTDYIKVCFFVLCRRPCRLENDGYNKNVGFEF